jgi:hypothetical protein
MSLAEIREAAGVKTARGRLMRAAGGPEKFAKLMEKRAPAEGTRRPFVKGKATRKAA